MAENTAAKFDEAGVGEGVQLVVPVLLDCGDVAFIKLSDSTRARSIPHPAPQRPRMRLRS